VSVTVTDGVTTTPPAAATVDGAGNWTVSGINVATLADGTITYTATATDSSSNTATAIRTATRAAVPSVSITTATDPITIANRFSASASGTTSVGATVTLTATDGTHHAAPVTATVDGSGNWSATGLDVSGLTDTFITYTATATDPGGTATANSVALKQTVTMTSATNPVTATNATNVSASGTVEVGATVSVAVTDGTHTVTKLATTDGTGGWFVTGIDVTGLNDGTITYTATATDSSSNTATATQTATKNTAANVTISTGTNPINIANQNGVSLTGTTDVGDTVTVVASDGTHVTPPHTATVTLASWTLNNFDVSGLDDGTITYTATASNGVGPNGTTSTTATKTTVAITSVTNPVVGGVVTSISGTAEVGAAVQVSVTDGTHTVGPFSAVLGPVPGTWSLPAFVVSALNNGPITYSATATIGGNSATTSVSATKQS
jgi:hypothetical protein